MPGKTSIPEASTVSVASIDSKSSIATTTPSRIATSDRREPSPLTMVPPRISRSTVVPDTSFRTVLFLEDLRDATRSRLNLGVRRRGAPGMSVALGTKTLLIDRQRRTVAPQLAPGHVHGPQPGAESPQQDLLRWIGRWQPPGARRVDNEQIGMRSYG